MAENNFEQKVLQLLEGMNQRFEKRFDDIDQRFEAMDRRFESIDQRFEKIDERLDAIDRRFETIDQRFEDMDHRLDGMDRRMTEGFEVARQERASLGQKLDVIQAQVVYNSERNTALADIKEEQRYYRYKIGEHDKEIFKIKEKLEGESTE